MFKPTCLLILFLSLSLLVGCNATAATPTTAPTAVPIAPTEATAVPTNTAVPPAAAAEPATATSLPASATEAGAADTPAPVDTAVPAETETAATEPEPSPTAAGEPAGETAAATATTAPAPPPSGNVEQPPYAPSPCSDKYPCNDDVAGWEARIRVPSGFRATYFTRVEGNPTSITFGPDGLLYVATRVGTIYTVNASGDGSAYASGFLVPTGIAFQPGTGKLYVASRVVDRNVGGEAQISVVQGGGASQIIGGLPCCYVGMHAANGIAFGPDGYGYVGVGARADHGEILVGDNAGEQDELHPYEASILRFSPDGSVVEVYARGFRNPYDIAWDANGQLYATDNGRDGDPAAGDYPPDELHRVIPGGQHGYPWYDCPVCFSAPPGVEVIPPIYNFISHSSVTGITAYLGAQFPGYYNSLFTTLWSAFPGAQKVMRFGPGGVGASNFATGFAAPIDVTVGPDGSLYVADYATGIIFKVSYTG